MFSLLLSTLAMMGLTFAIGFFVAGVIKVIAVSADSLDFYSSHYEELKRLRRLKKVRQKVAELIDLNKEEKDEFCDNGRESFSRGVNKELVYKQGYYHGVSHGASEMDLLDYYYPDTHEMYLRNREKMIQENKKHSHKPSAKKNK